MNIRKNNGPRIDPWGTPSDTHFGSENEQPNFVI